MRNNKDWSNAIILFEIGDVPRSNAIEFLVERHKMKQSDAEDLYDTVTGGRLCLMNMFVQGDGETRDVKTFRRSLHVQTSFTLNKLKMCPTDPFFVKLMGRNGICMSEAIKLLETKQLDELMEQRIITLHDSDAEGLYYSAYGPHSRHVTIFLEAALIKAGLNKNPDTGLWAGPNYHLTRLWA